MPAVFTITIADVDVVGFMRWNEPGMREADMPNMLLTRDCWIMGLMNFVHQTCKEASLTVSKAWHPAENARTSLAQYDNADEFVINGLRSNALECLNFPHIAQTLRTDVDRVLESASFNAAAMHGMTRVTIALAVAQRDEATPTDAVLNAILRLRSAAPDLEQLRRNFFVLDSVLLLSQSDNRAESIRLILDQAEKTQVHLRNIYDTLATAAYPYSHAASRTTLSQYAIGRLPAANEIGAVHTTSQAALKSLYTLYLRLLSDLARRTERLETVLGLEPLPNPPESDDLTAKLRSRYVFKSRFTDTP